ncbi:hypothetical protein D3C87_933150 [compost metagenome]
MRQHLALALTLAFGLTLSAHAAPPSGTSDRPAPPPGYGSDLNSRPAPPPGTGDRRPTPPPAQEAPSGPVEDARRTAMGALDRFEELSVDFDQAVTPQAREAIEVRMLETMGEALETIHRTISPRQGPAAEQIYRIVEPAYKKAWLQRYEWKQEQRPERKRERLRTLNLHLRQSLRDVRSAANGR